ncbi:hypothetical protein NNJEOMEG_02012 [Fundidesulfovibrio magnetotacticus]|uniref:Acyltransferase 3 domain-containing protein n=1 Tax=Fundidesulfovibrio magnetotacticus TaxID=2730080 RepID=A0A6V8LNI1_9BACT|nr:acyltransferase family protein [Fundidesulfovibrio magnetotacticus]GFK94172.1 hypothetical protein NNJEOMEG_02012 [Fundidesulfovibrio magnetotacticus]
MRFHGFDALRVFFCVCVSYWHIVAAPKVTRFAPDILQGFVPTGTDILSMNLLLLAVPVFMQVSMFLYVLNRETKADYFPRRMRQLFIMTLFWATAHNIILEMDVRLFLVSLPYFLGYLISTNTSFYFLVSLMIWTAGYEAVRRVFPAGELSAARATGLWVASMLVMLAAPWFFQGVLQLPYYYWNPMTFIPYLFGGILVRSLLDNGTLDDASRAGRVVGCLTALWLVLSVLEWVFLSRIAWPGYPDKYIMPPYARASLCVGALAIVCGAMAFFRKHHPLLERLAGLSFGVFCLHLLLNHWLAPFFSMFAVTDKTVQYVLVLMLSFAVTYCLKRYPWLV